MKLNDVMQAVLKVSSDVAALGERMDRRFDEVDRQFAEVWVRFEQVDRRFEQVDQQFAEVNRRFEEVDRQFEEAAARFSHFRETVAEHFEIIEVRLEARFDTFEGRATGNRLRQPGSE